MICWWYRVFGQYGDEIAVAILIMIVVVILAQIGGGDGNRKS